MSENYHIVGEVTELDTKSNPLNFHRTVITKITITDKNGTRYRGTRPIDIVDVRIGDRVKLLAILNNGYFTNSRHAIIV